MLKFYKNTPLKNKTLLSDFNKASKPSELLSIAIKEVESIIKEHNFDNLLHLNMDEWLSFMNGHCSVCLAGSILYGVYSYEDLQLKAIDDNEKAGVVIDETNQDLPITSLTNKTAQKFNTIDNLRRCFFIEDLSDLDNIHKLDKFVKNYMDKNYLNSEDIRLFSDPQDSIVFYKELVKQLKKVGA